MHTQHYPDVPPDFGNWLAGFIDGEGCFSIEHITRPGQRVSCYACRFSLRLRNDDLSILDEIQHRTGCGTIVRYKQPPNNSKPVALWQILDRPGCQRLVELLDRYPLRAKKARDYAIWREGVLVWSESRRGNLAVIQRNAHVWVRMAAIRDRLKAVRAYVPPHLPESKVRQVDAVPREDQLVLGEGVTPRHVAKMPAT